LLLLLNNFFLTLDFDPRLLTNQYDDAIAVGVRCTSRLCSLVATCTECGCRFSTCCSPSQCVCPRSFTIAFSSLHTFNGHCL
jgi:hypothetical protein